jgi:hypothetical protein
MKSKHRANPIPLPPHKVQLVKIKPERGYGDEDWQVVSTEGSGTHLCYNLKGAGKNNANETVQIFEAHTYQTIKTRRSSIHATAAAVLKIGESIGRKAKR